MIGTRNGAEDYGSVAFGVPYAFLNVLHRPWDAPGVGFAPHADHLR
jgi:hypothetical protein